MQSAYPASIKPDIILLDLRLPGMSGLEALPVIRKEDSAACCVVVTTYEGDEDIHQALAAGAAGYVIKAMSHDTLVDALRQVLAGGRFLPSPVARSLAARTPNSDLSPREREVLSLMVQGKSNKDIGAALHITEATVKSHVSVILERLGVSDRTQAVIAALPSGGWSICRGVRLLRTRCVLAYEQSNGDTLNPLLDVRLP